MKEFNLKVANDNGNSEHKIYINDELIVQPNVYAKVRKLPLFDDVNIKKAFANIQDNLIVSIDSPSVDTAGTYYIGNYAIASGLLLKNIEVGAINTKYESDIPIINTLARIAGYAAQKAYAEDNKVGEILVNVDMVTALPVKQYSRKTANLFASQFLSGPHKVSVIAGAIKIHITINFDYVKVLPESVPSVFYLQSLDRGSEVTKEFFEKYNLQKESNYFKNKKILHCAIGEGTTEYPLTKDIEFDPNFIEGTDNGIGHAIDRILNDFIEYNHLSKFSRQEYSNALRNKKHKYHNDALDRIYNELSSEADMILRNIKAQVSKANNDVDIIMCHGGGTILLKEHMYDSLMDFSEKTNVKVFFIPENEAITLEVKGLNVFLKSRIFEALKNKYIKNKSSIAQ
jgi:plasmid segregation protein ParM